MAEGVDDEMKGGEEGRAPPTDLQQVRLAQRPVVESCLC